LKLAVANSPEMQALRETKRGDAARGRAQKKLRRILAGLRDDVRPFSAAELAKLRPEELMRLRQLSSRRYAALDPEQRRRLSANLALIFGLRQRCELSGARRFQGTGSAIILTVNSIDAALWEGRISY
jgi:hypothetical protein